MKNNLSTKFAKRFDKLSIYSIFSSLDKLVWISLLHIASKTNIQLFGNLKQLGKSVLFPSNMLPYGHTVTSTLCINKMSYLR